VQLPNVRISCATRETDAAPYSPPHSAHFEGAEVHRCAAGSAALPGLVLRMILAQTDARHNTAHSRKPENPDACDRDISLPSGRGHCRIGERRPRRPMPITAPISPGAGAPPAMWSRSNRNRPASTCLRLPRSPEKVAFFRLDPHPKMPSFPLSRVEAADIAAYIGSLRR
jgi:hypothetical protein